LNVDRFIKVFCLPLTGLGEIPKFFEGGKGGRGDYRGVGELGSWKLGKLEYLGYLFLGY
jgi:hypothetical protein